MDINQNQKEKMSKFENILNQNCLKILQLKSENTFNNKQVNLVKDQHTNKIYFLYSMENILTQEIDHFKQCIAGNFTDNNKQQISILPKIIKIIQDKEFTFIQFESSSLNVEQYLTDQGFCFELFIDIILQLCSGVRKIIQQGFFIEIKGNEDLYIRNNLTLFICPSNVLSLNNTRDQQQIKSHFKEIFKNVFEFCIKSIKQQQLDTQFSQSIIQLLENLTNKLSQEQELIENTLQNIQSELLSYIKEKKDNINSKVEQLIEGNNLSRATIFLQLLSQSFEGDYQILYQIGCLYKQQNQLDKALSYLKKSVYLNPSFDSGLIEIGNIYLYELMEIDEAAIYFQKAIDANKNNDNAYFYLGYCFLNKGQNDKSIPLYEKCLQINENHALALLDLGWQNYLLNNVEKAIEYYRQSLKVDKTIDSTLLNLVNCLYILNRQEETPYLIEQISSLQGLVEYTHRLIVLDPLNHFLYHDLGIINKIKGDINKSLIAFKKCLEIKPDYIYKDFLIQQISILNNVLSQQDN